jgi:hypothetical protein
LLLALLELAMPVKVELLQELRAQVSDVNQVDRLRQSG